MRTILRALLPALLGNLLLVGLPAWAEDAATRGLAVAVEADARDTGFGNSTADLTMVLYNSAGDEIRRTMRQRILEVTEDGDHSVLVFDRPRDLKGTAILTHTHKVGNDDQWLYLPALDRVKRISSSDKSGPFMGSEFAYEDLASVEVEKYTYRYVGEDTLTQKCHVVERLPVDPRSGYSRQVAWYDQDHYRVLRVDYYDRKNELLKTMELTGYH
ncbi:MAG: outer membrane lipoprotein-sorting protein, partial [Halioglobus sp.]|nr:outer membrane lipoprotein-sorting protein [Halioglobus sp.]